MIEFQNPNFGLCRNNKDMAFWIDIWILYLDSLEILLHPKKRTARLQQSCNPAVQAALLHTIHPSMKKRNRTGYQTFLSSETLSPPGCFFLRRTLEQHTGLPDMSDVLGVLEDSQVVERISSQGDQIRVVADLDAAALGLHAQIA